MNSIYQYIQNNQTRVFLFSKIIGNILLLFFLLNFITARDTDNYKVMLIATVIYLIMTLFWGALFTNRKFEKNIAKTVLIIDWLTIFIFVYPAMQNHIFFVLLPATVLVTTLFLMPRNELKPVLAVFMIIFTLTGFVYGILDLFPRPAFTYASNLLILGVIGGVTALMINTLHDLQLKHEDLNQENKLLQKKYKKIEREMLLNKQQMISLDRDVRKKDIEIKNILSLSGQLNVRNDSRKVLTSFLLTAIGQLGSAYAAILTKQKNDQNFIDIFLQKGLRGRDLSGIRIYFNSSLMQVLNSIREPLSVSQLPRDGLYEDEIQLLEIFKEDIICPIFVKAKLSGVFIVGHKVSLARFEKEDLNLIAILANQMSFVLEQTQMTYEYQDFYAKTLRAMLRSLEAKYIYAKGHNVRTANYVNIMARKMGLPNKEIRDFSYGSLMHDIGKIAVKDEYLLSKDILSENETDLKEKILEHTVEGSKILKAAGFNQTITDMALHHHEFYNGGGFPHKIGYEDIPLGTKILAVCNAYDAMTSDRPHRKALHEATAKEYLQYYSGNQFDPELVKLFLNEISANKEMHKYH